MTHSNSKQHRFSTNFVGREKELVTLKNILSQVSNGMGSVVLIESEAGVGKTRLVSEFISSLKKVIVLKGRCTKENEVPYLPIIEPISLYFKLDKRPRKREIITKDLELKGLQNKTNIKELIESLSSTLSLAGFERALVVENSFSEKFRIFELVLQLLTKLSKAQPTILFIDDLQWADNATLDLLHYLAMNIRNLPVMIISAYRPEELHDIETAHTYPLVEIMRQMSRERLFVRIKLEHLTIEEMKKVFDSILKSYEFSNEFIETFYKETDGNPFFIEAVLKYMIENKDIRFENEKWSLKSEMPTLEFPDNVKDIVVSRLKQLFPIDLNVLEFAATIGSNFNFDVLRAVCELKDEQLLDIIDKLIHGQIIIEDKESEKTDYQFAHLKLREIIYSGIKLENKRINHKKVGYAIEKLYQNNLEEVIYDLGYHFFMGGEFEKASVYLVRAGRHAFKLSATEEAKKYCLLALQSLERLSDTQENRRKKIELLNFIGDIYRLTGELDKARKSYVRALKSSEILGDALREARTHRNIGYLKLDEELLESASHEIKVALGLSTQINDFYGIADGYRCLGKISWKLSKFENAIECFKISMEHWIKYYEEQRGRNSDHFLIKDDVFYEENPNAVVGAIYVDMGNVYLSKKDNDSAIECYEKGIEILENTSGHTYEISRAYNNLGFAYVEKGNATKALECFKKGIELSEKANYIILEIHGFNNIGTCYEQLDDLNSARKYWQKAEDLMSRLELKINLPVL